MEKLGLVDGVGFGLPGHNTGRFSCVYHALPIYFRAMESGMGPNSLRSAHEARKQTAKDSPVLRLMEDTEAAAGLAGISTWVLVLVAAIVLPVVGMGLLAALAPTYFVSLASLGGAFEGLELGNSTIANAAEQIGQSFGGIILIVGVVAFLGIAITVAVIKGRNMGS